MKFPFLNCYFPVSFFKELHNQDTGNNFILYSKFLIENQINAIILLSCFIRNNSIKIINRNQLTLFLNKINYEKIQ